LASSADSPGITTAVAATAEARPLSGFLLPYQARWVEDPSRFKIYEKSRRIGITYVQAYEDTVDAARKDGGLDVWFSSADESAAREYIRYCEHWAQMLNVAGLSLGEIVLNKAADVKAFAIEFANGKRINALSSNPKGFRSKGGKLILDEFAFHANPDDMWKAAAPIITWGFPVRVLSTYNGKGNRYYRIVEDAKKGNRWSLHATTIVDAIQQGLVDKILGHPATEDERQAFLRDCRETAGDEETFQQEYMCVPVDEATAWLPWDLITAVEHPDAGRPELYGGGDVYVGWDVARRRDLSVLWVDELVGDVAWTREVVAMRGWSFADQERELARILGSYRVRRCRIDQTGMGEKVVEDAQLAHGTGRIEGVLFTGPVKQDLATIGKQAFEDRKARIPGTREIRESHHSVRRQMTTAGNPRFDADRTEIGHADYFWAHMLALSAMDAAPGGPVNYTPAQPRRFSSLKGAW
jgi:phage FluMu gp28-like protein